MTAEELSTWMMENHTVQITLLVVNATQRQIHADPGSRVMRIIAMASST
jgi:hypothetical protein